jgi:hypothetical protein
MAMTTQSVQKITVSGKSYELDTGDAVDMLVNCRGKAECYALLAEKLHESGYDYDSREVQGFRMLLTELADDIGAAEEVLSRFIKIALPIVSSV